MENSLVKARRTVISKKSRSVDQQRLCSSGVSDEGRGKGRSGVRDDDVMKTKKRKSRRDVGLNSIEPKVKRSRDSLDDGFTSGSVKSDDPIPELGQNLNRSDGLTGFLLGLDGDGNAIRIPKKRRGSVGIKSHVPKPLGSTSSVDQTAQMKSDIKDYMTVVSSIPQHAKTKEKLIINKGNSADQTAKLNSDLKDRTTATPSIHRRAKKRSEQLISDEGNSVNQTARLKSDEKDLTTAIPSIPQHAKKKRKQFVIDKGNVGDASSSKGQSHDKKRKGLPLDSLEFAEKAQSAVDYIENISEDSLDDLEIAVMVLSSRFDRRCTCPPFKSKSSSSDIVDANGNSNVCLLERRNELMFSIGSDGMLELNLAVVRSKEFVTQLSLPVRPLLDFAFGLETSRFSRLSLLLQCGSVVTVWPKVYFEMLFVDNEVGLRFFQFEGCLKQAVAFVFVVLTMFCDTNKLRGFVDLQIPVTSIRFKLSCIQDLRKQLVFSFYSFSKMKHANWLYLDSMFQKHCSYAMKLPLPECTLENIKALESGRKQIHLNSVSWESFQATRRKSFQDIIPIGLFKSGKKNRRQPPNYNLNHGMLPFALSFNAAPLFFLSLHLKLLMESSIACVRLRECKPALSLEHRENICKSTSDWAVTKHCSEIFPQVFPESTPVTILSDEQHFGCLSCTKGHMETHPLTASMNCCRIISSLHYDDKCLDAARTHTCSRDAFWTSNTSNLSSLPLGKISPVWHGERTEVVHSGFGNGPRKPRTQVHYARVSGSSEFTSRRKPLNGNRLPFRRVRRASNKNTSDDSKCSQRSSELLACDSNVLITLGDRCWREFGVRVAFELADYNEWRLSVKFSEITKYSYKVHHVSMPGSTNRYTHAMMWKGGKDWALEFPDRSQWVLFKEMQVECYNRNIRAASVKNVPIPGVRMVEEVETNTERLPFNRSPKYSRQIENDVDMAMNPFKILYDMDSEDEEWISRHENSFETQETCGVVIADDLFEKTMDMLEKFAYAQQRDHFTVTEIEKLMVGVLPGKVINSIYQHWRQKRKGTGMPLIRHLQPPSWERYKQKMQEWNQLMTKGNSTAACGGRVTAPCVEKPAMFGFCLKPRGLEVPNMGLKRRAQKTSHVAGHNHALKGDQDGVHTFGRRSDSFAFRDEKATYPDCSRKYFSLNNDASDFDNHPKLYKNKFKKIGALKPCSNLHTLPSYSQKLGKSNGVRRRDMEFPDWPSQKHHQSERYQRQRNMQLGVRDLDEFRVRAASGAAKHASNIAKIKRENAQKLFCKADLAIHVAVSALMTANAVKASYCPIDR